MNDDICPYVLKKCKRGKKENAIYNQNTNNI